ncbi:hypothetical protein FDT80_15110 [Sulfitobacter sabulilitoris]|uniref:DUF2238 domain-containing protein n=2 Tax=Sulfitobacter sabulilitoris TaxID=2562655 RepID=A0A5S3PCD9_9RHOB|nr:hypothetical protein FDT80_15110 [Sulfitobacter sabulilitoris]
MIKAIWLLLVLAVLVALGVGRWTMAFVSLATLVLSLIPVVLASRFQIRLPLPFLAAITGFVFATIFMGEAFDFYERFWWWDLALHGSSAVGFGIIGFLFVFMLFEGDRLAAPPVALALITFCFAMTVGAIWEIFEFGMDVGFGLNMQKSGLVDTMGDLMINAVGALLAAVSGYFYLKGQVSGILGHTIRQFVEMNRKLYRKSKERLRK